jgi:hypothetical protein
MNFKKTYDMSAVGSTVPMSQQHIINMYEEVNIHYRRLIKFTLRPAAIPVSVYFHSPANDLQKVWTWRQHETFSPPCTTRLQFTFYCLCNYSVSSWHYTESYVKEKVTNTSEKDVKRRGSGLIWDTVQEFSCNNQRTPCNPSDRIVDVPSTTGIQVQTY